MPLAPSDLVKILNGLKYEQKTDVPGGRGEFAVGDQRRDLRARGTGPRRPASRIARLVREGPRQGDARPRAASGPTRTHDPGAGADHVPVRREPGEAAPRALRGAARPPGEGGAGHRGPALLQPSRPGPLPHRRRPRCATSQAESYIQGGSTITQQLVQELLPDARSGRSGARRRRRCSPSCSSGARRRRTSSSCT